jgi:hypothetical protein
MISVLGTTNKYRLQPNLLDMHHESLAWLSSTAFWKRESAFFQKLLDTHAGKNNHLDFKKEVDHFQSLITYYHGELIDALGKKLREHEARLAHMLQNLKESETQYFKEHQGLMQELKDFEKSFTDLKHDLYDFVERGFTVFGTHQSQ